MLFCSKCLYVTVNPFALQIHSCYVKNKQLFIFPPKGTLIKFKDIFRAYPQDMVYCWDSECILQNLTSSFGCSPKKGFCMSISL